MRKFVSLLMSLTLALMMVPAPAFAQVGEYAAASLEANFGGATADESAIAPDAAGEIPVASDATDEIPAASDAAGEADSPEQPQPSSVIAVSTSEIATNAEPISLTFDGESPDELFEAYVDRAFDEAATPVVRRAMLKAQSATADTRARAQLDSYNKMVYDALVPHIKAVAAGEETDTEFRIQATKFVKTGGLKERYYSEDLDNVQMLETVDGKTTVTQQAKDKFAGVAGQNYISLLYALLQDCNYELYWFDKVGDVAYPALVGLKAYYDESGKPYLTFESSTLVYQFRVTRAYSATNERDTFKTSGYQAKVGTAASNAAALVRANASKNDIRKLDAYRAYICENVDYDNEAAKADAEYGDPSQLISVFDDDPSTRAICEGYSKAFKRLCELTTFNNPTVYCYTTEGKWRTTSNAYVDHMWNTVSINGYKYLVDVTNCDTEPEAAKSGTGSPGSRWEGGQAYPGVGLFLVGYTAPAATASDSGLSSPTSSPTSYYDGYRIVVPSTKTNLSQDLTVYYYPRKAAEDVLPAGSRNLAAWDCPLEDAADAALTLDAQIVAVSQGQAATADEVAALKSSYAALKLAQKALVQVDPSTLDPDQIESNAAAASVKTLEWGKSSTLKGGVYSNTASMPGSVGWTCNNADLKKFTIRLYKEGGSSALFTRTTDFSRGKAERTSFSYYLPQDYIDLETGSYYFTVTPVLATGKPAPDESAISRSGIWAYTAPSESLHAPADIELTRDTLTWTQPSRSADPTISYISQYVFRVYHSTSNLDVEQLAGITFSDAGQPKLKVDGSDVTFDLVAGVFYGASPSNVAKKMRLDLASFMRKYAASYTGKGGYYYFYVRTVSSDISKYRTNLHSDFTRGLTDEEVVVLVNSQLDEIISDGEEVGSGGGVDSITAGSGSALIADRVTSEIHPVQLGIALEDAGVAEKVATLDAMTGVSVSVEQGAGAPDELFVGSGPSIVGAALNPLSSGSADEVKLVVDAASSADLVVPEGYDADGARSFSMSLEGVSDQESLTVPVRVSLPVPDGMAPGSVAVLHYENGAAEPTVIHPVVEERDGVSYASVVLTSFSDFAFVQAAGAPSGGDEFDIEDGDDEGEDEGEGGLGDEGDGLEGDDFDDPDPDQGKIANPVVNSGPKPTTTKSDPATTVNTPKSNDSKTGSSNDPAKKSTAAATIYQVKFVAGSGSGTMNPQLAKPGSTITLKANTFAWKAHRFIGWKGSDGKTYADQARVKVTGNLTLTAQWANVKTSKKVIYVLTNAKKSKIKATTSKKTVKKQLKRGWKKLAVVKKGSKKITKLHNPKAKRGAAKYYYTAKASQVNKRLASGWTIAATTFYTRSKS